MKRRTFVKASCISCASLSFLSMLLESCTPVKYVTGEIKRDGIFIDIKDFLTKENSYRSYVIVRNKILQYPICVYRTDNNTYNALYLKCSHQGAELQVSDNQLTCPAHGSEFDKLGHVTKGPAAQNLREFPVQIENEQLFIDLKKKG